MPLILRIWFIAMLVILQGCKPPTKESFVTSFGDNISREEGLFFAGFNVEKAGVTLLFYSRKHANLDEARRTITALAYKYEKNVPHDSNEEFIVIGVQFMELGETLVKEGYIGEVTLKDEILRFFVWDEKLNKLILIHKEPFEGAFEKSFGSDAAEGQTPFQRYY